MALVFIVVCVVVYVVVYVALKLSSVVVGLLKRLWRLLGRWFAEEHETQGRPTLEHQPRGKSRPWQAELFHVHEFRGRECLVCGMSQGDYGERE